MLVIRYLRLVFALLIFISRQFLRLPFNLLKKIKTMSIDSIYLSIKPNYTSFSLVFNY